MGCGTWGAASASTADRAAGPMYPNQSTSGGSSGRGRLRASRLPRWPWLAGLLVVAVIASAALVPGATVSITPATQTVGPKTYQLHLPIAGRQSDELRVTRPGTATGERIEQVAATGMVRFANWNIAAAVAVPQGTSVSNGDGIAFTTTERIVVPPATVSGSTIVPSHGEVSVTAVVPGTTGNLPAEAIDTVDDRLIRG